QLRKHPIPRPSSTSTATLWTTHPTERAGGTYRLRLLPNWSRRRRPTPSIRTTRRANGHCWVETRTAGARHREDDTDVARNSRRNRTGLVGSLVPGGPCPGAVGPFSRRGGRGRLHLDRTGSLRLPA